MTRNRTQIARNDDHHAGLQRRATVLVVGALAWVLAAVGGCKSTHTAPSEYERVRAEEADAARKSLEHVKEAERLEKLGHSDDAIQEYIKAVASYRELPAAWNNLGRLMMAKGQNNAAAEAFRTAADLSPADPLPVYNLGALWESLGWPDQAAIHYSEALNRDPNHLPSLRRSILLDVNLGRATDQTESRLRKAMSLETDATWLGHLKRAKVRMSDGSMTVRRDPDAKP